MACLATNRIGRTLTGHWRVTVVFQSWRSWVYISVMSANPSIAARGRLQFSLKSLVALTLLLGVGLSYLAVKLKYVRRQREAAYAVEKLGGRPRSDESPAGPVWLTKLLGEDLRYAVDSVKFPPTATDSDLLLLEAMPHLQYLELSGCRRITDAGLAHVACLKQLQWLLLNETQVTDADLLLLEAMPHLQYLELANCRRITDAGLAHVVCLPQLQWLTLSETQVTDAGLAQIGRMQELVGLFLSGDRISDMGLIHVGGLRQLHTLAIDNTPITDAGLVYLQPLRRIRTLNLTGTRVGDAGLISLEALDLDTLHLANTRLTDAGLARLRGFQSLTWLDVGSTQVTKAGRVSFQQARPQVALSYSY